MRRITLFLLALVLISLSPGSTRAAQPPLVVGTHPVPPFVIKGDDGSWSGISIDLWRRVAEKEGLPYEIREYPVEGLLKPDPAIDVVVLLNVTSKAESVMDLTHAFYSTGLTIAVIPAPAGFVATLKQVFSRGFLGTLGVT